MQRIGGFLALLAGGLLVAAVLLGATPFAVDNLGIERMALPGRLEPISFAAGFAAAIAAGRIYRVPWGSIPQRMLAAILGWRRNFAMMSLAAICAGVLLFY